MTGCGVIPAPAQVATTPLVIPASEPVSMVVAVAWFSGLWMPDQVRHDGVWGHTGLRAGSHYASRHTGLRAGIHGGGRGVVQWSMDAGSSPA
jgi:hypothetical protein